MCCRLEKMLCNSCSMSGARSTLEIAYGNLGTRIPKSLHSCIKSLSIVERTWKNIDMLMCGK